jgi:superfamily I DNA/RNA helicase
MQFSPQQEALFDWVRNGSGSVFLRARAGTGKTTTLIGAVAKMTGSVALAAYNKKIATEIGAKLQAAGIGNNQARAGTFHSFGFAAVRRVMPKVKVDERAKREAIRAETRMPGDLEAFSMRLMSLAKQSALGLYGAVEDESRWWKMVDHHDLTSDLEEPERARDGILYAQKALQASNAMARELIDFDDMIYLPAVNSYRIWQNDWLLVDEAQDTNHARRALARKMLRPNGRSIWVGDDRQAIYGFTGADADSIDIIRRDFDCQTLPLTVTYRCPKAVVALANDIVPDIEAHESAPTGEVKTIDAEHLVAEELRADDAILCRKTAPLISLAYKLIKANVACHVEGREIGQGLLKLARRWKVKSLAALRDKLADYRERETEKLMAKGKETQAEALGDRIETLLVLMEGCEDVQCVVDKIGRMFQDDAPTLTLSTVHKAKGREWNRVYILGARQFMPSPFARQDWQKVQEQNLIYVAYTRAKQMLALVNIGGTP